MAVHGQKSTSKTLLVLNQSDSHHKLKNGKLVSNSLTVALAAYNVDIFLIFVYNSIFINRITILLFQVDMKNNLFLLMIIFSYI